MAGTITVGELLSDPTSGNKITIGSGTTLDLASGAGSVTGAGKVLQFAYATKSTSTTFSDSSYGWNKMGFNMGIAPKFANSKIVIEVRNAGFYADFNDMTGGITLYRNDTTNVTGSTAAIQSFYNNIAGTSSNGDDLQHPISLLWVDSPNTTSYTDYEVYCRSDKNTTRFNGSRASEAIITVMEVAQ
jgi:hypothetical protein